MTGPATIAQRLALLRDEAAFVALFREVAVATDRKGRAFTGLTAATELATLGIDSFTLMEILGRLEERLDGSLSDLRIAGLRRVGDVARAFEAELEELEAVARP